MNTCSENNICGSKPLVPRAATIHPNPYNNETLPARETSWIMDKGVNKGVNCVLVTTHQQTTSKSGSGRCRCGLLGFVAVIWAIVSTAVAILFAVKLHIQYGKLKKSHKVNSSLPHRTIRRSIFTRFLGKLGYGAISLVRKVNSRPKRSTYGRGTEVL